MDSDWGSGGDYSQVNGDEYKDRPDIEVDVCENCWAIADNLLIDQDPPVDATPNSGEAKP
jgi:hypothetical protein